jgi:two-component system OmpR family sensor kinase
MSDATTKARGSLWVRVSVLGIAIAIITGVLAGGLAIGLIRSSDDHDARRVLGKLANAAQTSVNNGKAIDQVRLKRRVLQAVRVRYGEIEPNLTVSTDYPLVRRALSLAERRQVLAGESISESRTIGGKRVYLEARPAGPGGVILLQARADATAGGEAAIRRTLLAIAIGIAIAAVLGVLVARRITRPLRTTAAAAHALAAGRRDVVVPLSGPAEVAEVAEAVNTLAGALSQSEARQREFLMSVSHDLRTPLTAITGYAESLAEGVVPPERTGEVGTVMLGEAQRLERLVGDLLDLARLGAQDFRVEFATVDLVELARAAAQVWSARCQAVGVTFALEAAPALAWTDASRLRQVLDGLMENALRVTPAGRPIVLAVRAEPDGRARAEVRDGGPGLTDDDLAVAFRRSELYERYRGVRQVGTGLGLAIVHGLVTRLGGTVEAGHAAEGGARFTVRLPPIHPDRPSPSTW